MLRENRRNFVQLRHNCATPRSPENHGPSTLELGIDVGDLDHVFQGNAPGTVSSFLQRMGRTGRRANTVANTTFFCDNPEAVLQAVALVELAREGWVETIPPQERCWPVLVHQLLAFTLAAGGVSRDLAWEKLSRLPDLAGIMRFEFDQTVDYMVLHDGRGGRAAVRAKRTSSSSTA
jgi:ATP-dependent Lhr-like helicase